MKQPNCWENTALSKIAEPPSDLHQRILPIVEKEGELFRISGISQGASGVIYYGKTKTGRFDDPNGLFGVCYLGEDEFAAFIEVFGQSKGLLIDLSYIHESALSTLEPNRKLKLVDITANGAAGIGAAGEVSAGDHALSQRWSRALYMHPENIDGIYYRCRHNLSKMSIALFDKEPDILKVNKYSPWSDTTANTLLGNLLDHYKFAIRPE